MRSGLARRTGNALLWKAVQIAGSRGISLVGTLILARLLLPEDFGLLAIGMLTIEVLLSFTNLGINLALIQRPDLKDTDYDIAWMLGLFRALAILVVAIITAPFIATFFEEPRATDIIRVLALGPVFSALSSARVADLARSISFRPLAVINVSAAFAQTASAIGMANSFGVWALVVGSLLGNLIQALLSYRFAPYKPRFPGNWSRKKFFFQFGKWILISGVIGMLADTILRMIIARQLGTLELGLYYLGARLALLPNAFISEALGQVAFPLHAKLQHDPQKAARVIRASLIGSWTILLPAYAILIVITPTLIAEVLGDRWSGAEFIIRILAVAGIIGAIFDATTPMFQGRGRPQYITAIFAIRAAVVIPSAQILIGRYGATGAAITWLIAEVVIQITCVILTKFTLHRPFAGISRQIFAIISSAVGGALASALAIFVISGIAGLMTSIIIGAASALAVLWALDHSLRLGLFRDLFQVFPALALWRRRINFRSPNPELNLATDKVAPQREKNTDLLSEP